MDEITFLYLLDDYACRFDFDELCNYFKEILFSVFDGDLFSMFSYPDEKIRAFIYYVAWRSVNEHSSLSLDLSDVLHFPR